MQIKQATLETCSTAGGVVVVIDVIRAFTVAPFAFAANAGDIVPVSTVEEALALRDRLPGSLVMGEVGGFPPKGFDFGNSPAAMIGQDLQGRRLIQRTGAGTQGIVRSAKAQTLLAVSFVCASATIRYIQQQAPEQVTLVSTDPHGEDQACAEYLGALLRNQSPNTAALLGRVREAGQQRIVAMKSKGLITEAQQAEFEADIDCCIDLDRFDFALLVERRGELLVMETVTASKNWSSRSK